MRTRLLALPGALEREGEPALREILGESFRTFESGCEISKLESREPRIPESAWTGLDPSRFQPSAGVLAVSAFGADPPSRSVHFQLSVLSLVGDRIGRPEFVPMPEESEAVYDALLKLETARLKLVKGRELEHGLVWEDGSIELGTQSPAEAIGRELHGSWPEGDGEAMLRRLIDDSVNILSDLETNRRRVEEGQLPFNLAWPWGPGFRPSIPNLALQRGAPVLFIGTNPRQLGMTRMAGYRHADPWSIGKGTSLDFESILGQMLGSEKSVTILSDLGAMRDRGRFDELDWLGSELHHRLLSALLDDAAKPDVRFALVATDRDGGGLAGTFEPKSVGTQARPFSASTRQESSLASESVFEFMARELSA